MLLEKLKQNDYDRYISTQLAAKDKISDILVLLELNIEIASIKNRVSEHMIGLIRLEWWREAIDEIYDEQKMPRKHHIVDMLVTIIKKHDLSKEHFLTLINAREKDLEQKPFLTETEFFEYAKNTNLPLNLLLVQILGGDINDEAKDVIEGYSKAWAIIAMLFSANKNFSKGRNILPLNMCDEHKVKIDNYGGEEFISNSKRIIEQLVNEAEELNQQSFKVLTKQQRKILKPILAYKVINQSHIRQIKRNKFNVFSANYNPYFSLKTLFKIFWI